MKICLDVQSAVTQLAGVGRYTRLLAQHLGAMAKGDSLVLAYFDFRRKGTPFPAPGAQRRAIRWMPGRIAQALWKRLNWPPFDALAGSADLYHFPNFIVPPLRHGKSVVTIHDMSFLRYPQFAEDRNRRYLAARIRDTVARADAIITDSHFSATEIQELLGVEAARVFPIPLGVAGIFRPPATETTHSVLAGLHLDRPYLLSVGTIEPRKNYAFLIDLFERLTDFDGNLVIAGSLGWKYEPFLERVRNSPRAARIRHVAHLDDTRLPSLYAGAEALVMPSLYEGFGLPPLEAMACGTPVVSSAGGSLKEVAGDAAVVVETFDIEPWLTGIRKVLSDAGHRQKLVAAGLQRAAGYTWAETARRTWDVYRKVAG